MTDAHTQSKTIDELAHYPKHENREPSAEYEQNHDYLVHQRELPCYVCGRTWQDARDAGMWLETHHMVPWATFNAVDGEKFNALFDPDEKGVTLDPYGYAEELKGAGEVDSPDHLCVLLVLCSECHRYTETGIHETTGPLYVANMVTADGRGILHGDAE